MKQDSERKKRQIKSRIKLKLGCQRQESNGWPKWYQKVEQPSDKNVQQESYNSRWAEGTTNDFDGR